MIFGLASRPVSGQSPRVDVGRVPGGGLQPQLAVDSSGVVHLIYLKGDPGGSDVFYVRSADGGVTWSKPIRVNQHAGSALAMGTVRGVHMALGRDGQIHIAWMGSKSAEPRGPGGSSPMLYTRLAADRAKFEPERNVVVSHAGLDGGGSIAADETGIVFVAWHAPAIDKGSEQTRRVWIARSTDDGKTFALEQPVSDSNSGACGCCGMRLFAAEGKIFALYRSASEQVNRGMHLIDGNAELTDLHDREIAPMRMGMCVMSTSAMAQSPGRLLAAWETQGRIFWSAPDSKRIDAKRIDPKQIDPLQVHVASANTGRCKHPAIAANSAGQVLVAWAEGTGWNKGGSVAWMLFDAAGQPIPGSAGGAGDLPAWDAPAVISCKDGGFLVVY